LPIARRAIIPPAIDPLSPKNMDVDATLVSRVLDWIGIDSSAPLVTQVSRFDPWKDPMGVIQAYRLARDTVPGLQLALVGSMALDDPQGWEVYRQIDAARQSDPLLHIFTNLTGVGNLEVNAFQRRSAVVIQKSIREGFGLVISEALWKGTPVVAGRAGGIPLQMDDTGGFLVDSVEDCASRIVELLHDHDLARELGAGGRQRVRRHFLLPRLIADELRLLAAVRHTRPVEVGPWEAEAALEPRDPVCGMPVQMAPGVPATAGAGRPVVFCSDRCRQRFARKSGTTAHA
jgi:trehalose synthase